jgi:phage shock protein A
MDTDRLAALQTEERRLEDTCYALFDQLQAARVVYERLERTYTQHRRQLAAVTAERQQLLDEDQRGRLYRERGA